MVAPVHRRSLPRRRFPAAGMARGWYQVGWSTDFAPGEPVALHYFDSDLVAYRSTEAAGGGSGKVQLLDAYCRHLGAHLAFGGRVEGECIRCPYHGWLYDADGENIEVPYGSRGSTAIRLSSWPTHEVDGVVLAWYDPVFLTTDVEPPLSFARSEHETWPLSDGATKLWPGLTMTPQAAADNVCDAAHFKYIHRSFDVPKLTGYEEDGEVFRASYEIEFGGGMERTWATPEGPVMGSITTEARGVGLMWNRLGGVDDVCSLLGVTPIDERTADMRVSVWVPRQRRNGEPMSERIRDRWIEQQHSQVESDLLIWANQTFIERPPFLREEAVPMRAFRAYSAKWYPTRQD